MKNKKEFVQSFPFLIFDHSIAVIREGEHANYAKKPTAIRSLIKIKAVGGRHKGVERRSEVSEKKKC